MCLDKVLSVLEIVVIHVMLISVDFPPIFTHSDSELATSI